MQPCFIYGLVLLYRFTVAVPSAQQFVAKVNIFRIRSLAESYRKSPLSLLSPCLLGDLQHSSIGKYHKKQEEHGVIREELHTEASSQNPKEGRHNQGSHIGGRHLRPNQGGGMLHTEIIGGGMNYGRINRGTAQADEN